MHRNYRRVPWRGVETEQLVIYPTPDQKYRSIVPNVLYLEEAGVAVPELLSGESFPQKRPMAKVGIADEHCYIIEDKLTSEAFEVNHSGDHDYAP
jgi:hypothetical protein